MTAKAAELRRLGKPVFNMSVGEPDFPTPENIQQAGIFAIQNGHTKYTPGSGTFELKEAIQSKFKVNNDKIRVIIKEKKTQKLKDLLVKKSLTNTNLTSLFFYA